MQPCAIVMRQTTASLILNPVQIAGPQILSAHYGTIRSPRLRRVVASSLDGAIAYSAVPRLKSYFIRSQGLHMLRPMSPTNRQGLTCCIAGHSVTAQTSPHCHLTPVPTVLSPTIRPPSVYASHQDFKILCDCPNHCL
jgi:hypothetical protein